MAGIYSDCSTREMNILSVCPVCFLSLMECPQCPDAAIVRCGLRGISWSISSRNVHTTCARTSALNRTDKRRRAARRIDVSTSRSSCGNNILRVFIGQLSEVVPFLLLQQSNGLPSDVTSASSLSVFKNSLKTYLFRRCYETV